MRKELSLYLLISLLSTSVLFAQEARKDSIEGYSKFRFGGYGEIGASYLDHDWNRATPHGTTKGGRAEISVPRFITAFDYKFNNRWSLGAEIEFEYGGTGCAREIEWYEENGEYEVEVEKGGEVALEQVHLTYSFSPALNLRVGHIIVPIGLTNAHHEPINFFGVYRPEGETSIIPSTWHETGVELLGSLGHFDYHLQVVSGLDPQGFRSEDWVKKGRQGMFEKTNFSSPAVVARLEYKGVKGLRIGGSFYFDNTAKNASKPHRNTGYKFPVLITSGDISYVSPHRDFILRANAIYGYLGASAALTKINNRSSNNSGYSHTTVAETALCYGGELGYNVGSLFGHREWRVYPFLRYEYYNPMERVEAGSNLLADKRMQVSACSVGVNYYALPNLVVKADYMHRTIGRGAYNSEILISLGIAYVGWFFSK